MNLLEKSFAIDVYESLEETDSETAFDLYNTADDYLTYESFATLPMKSKVHTMKNLLLNQVLNDTDTLYNVEVLPTLASYTKSKNIRSNTKWTILRKIYLNLSSLSDFGFKSCGAKSIRVIIKTDK